jgi:hypothetical protein
MESCQITAEFHHTLTTNRTQHDLHGPDDSTKTIHYHHLDMSRDGGMDEHGIDWLNGCHQVGFWIGKLSNHRWLSSRPDHKSDPA